MAQARSARAINRRGKTRVRNLQYGPRNEVSKIFIISLYLQIERAKGFFKLSWLGLFDTKTFSLIQSYLIWWPVVDDDGFLLFSIIHISHLRDLVFVKAYFGSLRVSGGRLMSCSCNTEVLTHGATRSNNTGRWSEMPQLPHVWKPVELLSYFSILLSDMAIKSLNHLRAFFFCFWFLWFCSEDSLFRCTWNNLTDTVHIHKEWRKIHLLYVKP